MYQSRKCKCIHTIGKCIISIHIIPLTIIVNVVFGIMRVIIIQDNDKNVCKLKRGEVHL
jgi:hypothetical protein